MGGLRSFAVPVVLKDADAKQVVDQLGPGVRRGILDTRKGRSGRGDGREKGKAGLGESRRATGRLHDRTHGFVPQRFLASSDVTRRKAPKAAWCPRSRPDRSVSAPPLPSGPRAVICKRRVSRLSSP